MRLKSMQAISDYHPAIGLVVFSLAWTQPVSGLIHHALYVKKNRRTIVAWFHIWIGRILITLGIINGGLGLLYSHDGDRADYIAYGVVAAVVWLAWIAVSVFGAFRGGTTKRVDGESKVSGK